MTEQAKLNLVTNYFAEDWAIDKAMQLLDDYQKMTGTQSPLSDAQYACVTELEQAAHQALEVLDYYAKPLCMCFAGCDECDPSKVPNEQMVITALRKALSGVQALSAASPTPPAEQAQPDECFPGEPKVAVPQGLIGAACCVIRNKSGGGKVLEQLRRYSVGDLSQPLAPQQAAPKAAPGVGSSGFDYQTAADFLSGKTISDEAVRRFVAASRWAHDERAALSATLLAMHGVLTSREAEIALLKKALLEAEDSPEMQYLRRRVMTM